MTPKHRRTVSPEATTLLEWKESAYGTNLFVQDRSVSLLTQREAVRITVGEAPRKLPLPLGPGATLVGDQIVYWHEGAVRAVSQQGGKQRTLGPLKRPPQRFVAWRDRFAWLDRSEDGAFSLQAFDGNVVRVIYRTNNYLAAATMLEDWVFFVERIDDASWRVGGAAANGKSKAFSGTYRGRTPSMLAPSKDGLHFYDGPTRTVRRLSPGLEEAIILAKDVICSPLAVSDRVLCAQVGGVFEIARAGAPPRMLSRESAGPIAAIAADELRIAWVVDTGENELAVRSLALASLDSGDAGSERARR